jgi:glycosyltransferase involved in cell wall biosynthesis
VFAGCEDFGIVLAEAQACGTPLIAFERGGASDIVRNLGQAAGPTGVLFGTQTTEAVRDAVERFEANGKQISAAACRENTARFAEERFHRNIADAWERTLDIKKRDLRIAFA